MGTLTDTPLHELAKNVAEMGRLARIASNEKSSTLPEIRARGTMQLPIFVKVRDILQEELAYRIERQEAERAAIYLEVESPEAWENAKWAEADREDMVALFEAEHPKEARIDIDSPSDFSTPSTHLHIRDGYIGTGDYAPEVPLQPMTEEQNTAIVDAMLAAVDDSLRRIFAHTLGEYMELWLEKHHDYGYENHAIWGCKGVIVRMCDKAMRLKRTYFNGIGMLTDKVEDNWMDSIGYALIGLVIERGQWPSLKLHAVIEAMKAEAHTMPKPPNEFGWACPSCGSPDIHIEMVRYIDKDLTAYDLLCGDNGFFTTVEVTHIGPCTDVQIRDALKKIREELS